MNIHIQKLEQTDIEKFNELIRVFEEVFEMENLIVPEEKHLIQLLEKEDFFVFVALSDNMVLGGLTAYVLQQYYSVSTLVFIYDIAVKTDLQRQGVGKLLMDLFS